MMNTTIAGWVVVNTNGEGKAIPETFAETEKMAIANWVDMANRMGNGFKPWDRWKIDGYETRRALLRLQ